MPDRPGSPNPLVEAPDPNTWTGPRGHALLDVSAQTRLRASELTALRNHDIDWAKAPTCDATERAKRTGDAAAERNGDRAQILDDRTRRRTRRSALPDPARHPAEPSRRAAEEAEPPKSLSRSGLYGRGS